MKKKPGTGVFYRSAGSSTNPPICISLQKYTKKYFVSRYQIKRLLAKKIICGVRFKGRLFIPDSPPPTD